MDTTRPTISAPPEQPKPDIAYMSELGRTGQVAKAVDEREARVLGDRRDRRPPVDTRTNTPVFASGRANARLRRLGEHTVQISASTPYRLGMNPSCFFAWVSAVASAGALFSSCTVNSTIVSPVLIAV
jgi:hypothetical protein